MLAFAISLAVLVCAASAGPLLNNVDDPAGEPKEARSNAIKRLLEVFGMEEPPAIHERQHPPQYMMDLYDAVADVDGMTKDPYLLEGNTVRSFYDKLHSDEEEFSFNLSVAARTETIISAELHLFKLRPQPVTPVNRYHFSKVSVFQLFDSSNNSSAQKKLLASRVISVYSYGWEVFIFTKAFRSSVTDETTSLRLHVVVQTLGGMQMDGKMVRFAKGHDHHQSKQPMLVLFTDDGRFANSLESTVSDYSITTSSLPQVPMSIPPSRKVRSLDNESEGKNSHCQLLPLFVDFEDIGWSGWIVSPKVYNAYHCKGSCNFPLGQAMKPTNHATVQSIINALNVVEGVEKPCCVPDKLNSINLLFFDDDENVVLKQYNNMVAVSCGCQ